MDLRHVISFDKPAVRVTYELEEIERPGVPTLRDVIAPVLIAAMAGASH
jgi:hypothetical protein